MATLARRDITWEAAKASADVDFPPSGVASIVSSTADNQDPLAAWLPQFLDAVWTTTAAASGYVEGERDAVRYAIEASGDAVVARDGEGARSRRLLRGRIRINVLTARDGTLALLESWTPGVVIALSVDDGDPTAAIVRNVDGDIIVALSTHASARAAGIVERLREGAHEPRRPVARGARSLLESRTGVVAACALTVVAGATAAGVALWRTHTGSSDSSRQPAVLRPTPDAPSRASSSLLASDPLTGHLLLVGCCDLDSHGEQTLVSTWSWDGATWTHLHPATSPATSTAFQREASIVAADADGTILLQGGAAGNETWSWAGNDWMRLQPTQQPPGGRGRPMVYDATTGRVITFTYSQTNEVGGPSIDTWAMERGTWTKAATSTSGPSLSFVIAIAYDPDTRQIVVLIETDGFTATTWTFSNDAWTKRPSPTDLSLDSSTQLAWDDVYHRIVALHLGDAATPVRNSTTPADTWVWDGSAWTSVPTPAMPDENGRLITTGTGRAVFIGDHVNNGAPDVWEWAGTTWRLRTGNVTDIFTRSFAFDISPALLDAAGWAVIANPQRFTSNPTQARTTAYAALPVPGGAGEHLRLRATGVGSVIDIVDPRNPTVCDCWVEDVVLTNLPPCPSVESVERETVVLVDVATLRVVKTFGRAPAPGETFGFC